MNTVQLESFMAVANFLNFSKAADQMCLTQPAISHQISMLEEELGAKLFYRTSKTVRLTDEGMQFLHYAEEMLRIAGLSKARMKILSEKSGKRVIIGVRNSIELRILNPVLRWYAENGDGFLPIIRMMPFDSLTNMLLDGDIDVIFSFSKSDVSRLRFRLLSRPDISVICSKTDRMFLSHKAVGMDELGKIGKMAICRPPYCPDELFQIQGRVLGARSPEKIFFCDNLEIVEELCATGYAFALSVDLKSARRQDIEYIPLKDAPPIQFGALTRKAGKNTVLDAFLNKMEELLNVEY